MTRRSGTVPAHQRALESVLPLTPTLSPLWGAREQLAEWLYATYFIRATRPSRARPLSGDPAFVAALNAQCAGATTWESGFRHAGREGSGVFVEHPDLRLWVPSVAELKPRHARVGQPVQVRLPCAREAALPGYFAFVSRAGRIDDATPHLKFYVNASPAAAVALMGRLATAPSLRRARFEAKVLNDPADFGRLDTFLVYAAPEAVPALTKVLRAAKGLRRGAPPMTREIAAGVSTAESPAHHAESFGAHRCRLIAEAVVTARRERRPLATTLSERFEREGLSWRKPWLG